jgi:hypothetical protein
LIQDRLDDYSEVEETFSTVVMGAGLGGATSFLSLALSAPFLPQSFVISIKNGSYKDDADEYLQRSLLSALQIANSDPRLMTIQHFDPIHDGWLTKFVNHLRFKLVDLPDQYIKFIRERIKPGGTVVYLESAAEWLRYRLGERSVFQIGGWGDIQAGEFLDGSPRLTDLAKGTGQKLAGWRLKADWPLEIGPESEWGSESGLADAIENFCRRDGFEFIKIHFPHPNDFSRLAFEASRQMLNNDGREPAGTLIECFSQFDSFSALKSGLLPLWLIFNTTDSARFLKEIAPQFPPDKPIFFSPLATFSLTPDMANWEQWVEAIGGNFFNIGTRQTHYPSDAKTLVSWADPLRSWVLKNEKPVLSRLTPKNLVELAKNINL